MAIITKEVNGHKYLYEITYENGKHKWKSLGRVDENGELIASKKKNRRKAMTDAPAEIVLKTITKKYVIRPKVRAGLAKKKKSP